MTFVGLLDQGEKVHFQEKQLCHFIYHYSSFVNKSQCVKERNFLHLFLKERIFSSSLKTKRKNFLYFLMKGANSFLLRLEEQILTFKSRPPFGRAMSSKETDKKSE